MTRLEGILHFYLSGYYTKEKCLEMAGDEAEKMQEMLAQLDEEDENGDF